MNFEPDPKLESLLDAELRKLPPVPAPPALLRNVLAQLEARERLPWWRRSWWDWPLAAKAAFLVIAICAGAIFSGGSFVLGESADGYSQLITQRLNSGVQYESVFAPVINAVLLIWHKAAQPFLLHLSFLALGLYLTCLALGTVCFRYAFKRS